MTNEEIYNLAIKAGFTPKFSDNDGKADLKHYVYVFARSVIHKCTQQLTKSQVLGELTRLKDTLCAVELQFAILDRCLDTVGTPLSESVFNMQAKYIDLVAEKLGVTVDLLTDWALTHDYGRVPMKIYAADQLTHTIKSNDDFAKLIVGLNSD